VVREFGKPWDIMRGALRRSKEEIKNYVITDVGPNIVEEATSRAYGQAFSSQQRLFMALVIAVISFVVAGVIRLHWPL